MRKTLASVCFLLCANAQGADQLYYLGGGGEGMKTSTIFDYNISNVQNITSSHKLDYQISFNGGHKDTEDKLKTYFPSNKVTNFTEKNFNDRLKEIERKLSRGEIKPTEKLLLIIDSHGAESNKELTHSISLANNKQVRNLDNLNGSDSVSLDRLKKIADLAEAKGVKLGIVDFSCHSGSTLNLAKTLSHNICVISSTGPRHYGYAGNGVFADLFMKELAKPHMNLETAFLRARRSSIDAGYPMISTPVHKMIANQFYGDLTNLLYYERLNREGKLVSHIKNKDIDCIDCSPMKLSAMAQLKFKISKLKIQGILEHVVADNLIAEIEKYNAFQQNLVTQYNKLNIPKLNNKETFSFPEINPDTKKPYINQQLTWYEILNSNEEKTNKAINKLIKQQQAAKTPSATLETFIKVSKKFRDSVAQKKAEILRKYPDILNASEKFNQLAEKNNESYKMVVSIAQNEKKLYDSLYSNQTVRPNACNQFIL